MASGDKTLWHYTDRNSATGIEQAGQVNASTGEKHTKFGQGVYLSDMAPGSHNQGQVAQSNYANPGGQIPPNKADVAIEFRVPADQFQQVEAGRGVHLYSGNLDMKYATGQVYEKTSTGAYKKK